MYGKPGSGWLKAVGALALIGATSGCNLFACKSCRLDTRYVPIQAPQPEGLPKEIEYVVPPQSQKVYPADSANVTRAALPQIPTAAIVMAELNNMLTELSAMVDQVGGEARATILQTQTSASQLLSELDHVLGNRVNQTIDRLEGVELRMVEDAQALTAEMTRSADLIRAGLLESAKESLWEADILAWNAQYSLPCRDKPARLVYAKPRKLRIWADEAAPGGLLPNGQLGARELSIPIRGNFLTIRGAPRATAMVGATGTERPAVVTGANQNQFTVTLDEATVRELQAIRRPTLLTINGILTKCTAEGDDYSETRSSVSIEVLPPLTYQVSTSITPVVFLPVAGHKVMQFSEVGSNKCNDNYRADRIWSVGPPAKVTDWNIAVTSANGGSHVIRTDRSGAHSVLVEARVRGAGRDCVLSYCNCKGRGWLSYNLGIYYTTDVETDLETATFTTIQPQASYVFSYPLSDFPANHTKKTCRYYGRVVFQEGDSETVVELTESNPNVTTPYGTVGSRVNSDCQVTLELPQQAAQRLRRIS